MPVQIRLVCGKRGFLNRRKYLWFTQKKTMKKDNVGMPENASIPFADLRLSHKEILTNDPEKAV